MANRKELIVNKLVRNKIPAILLNRGLQYKAKSLNPLHFETALKQKLIEEIMEYIQADAKDQLEELADVLEVIHTLLAGKGIEFSELENLRKVKLEERGGFQQRIFLEKIISHEPVVNDQKDCLFCQIRNRKFGILAKFEHCFAIEDGNPVTPGHILIIPNEHVENWFRASKEVQLNILLALENMKKRLDKEYNPGGYNFGVNCGKVAGQSIMHLHVHLIPRYSGDMQDPKGGVRGVIPAKQCY